MPAERLRQHEGMRRALRKVPLWAVVTLACTGCDLDWKARRLIDVPTTRGKLVIAMYPAGRDMVARGDIDLHREIRRPDGAEIDVWVLRGRDGDGKRRGQTCVLLHGVMGSKAEWLSMGKGLAERGFDVVLLDHRAHGRSGGRYVTFGALEHRDVKAVVDELVVEEVIAPRLCVFGVSMGATTAILYAAVEPRCETVLAVAPFADIRSAIGDRLVVVSEAEFETILARAGELAGCDFGEVSTVDAAARLKCPLMIVHGELDIVVPYEHGQRIFAVAGGPKRFKTLRFGGHTAATFPRAAYHGPMFAEWIDQSVSPAAGQR